MLSILGIPIGQIDLDQWMAEHSIGDMVRIRRLDNKPSKYGNPLQMYEVDHPKQTLQA